MANAHGPANNASPEAARVELVYCPLCTHTVPAEVILKGKRVIVRPGQKCARCHSPTDAGYVFRRERAA
jgi:sarcosine oxidase delta subunit